MAIHTDSMGSAAEVSGNDDSKEQNAVVRKWISMVQKRLKLNTASFSHGKNQSRFHHGRLERKLTDSLRSQTKQKYGVIDQASIIFERHGVFVHKGVGRGYKMVGGTVVRTAKSVIPLTTRVPREWFNPAIDQLLPELVEKLEQINTDAVINATRLVLK